MKSLEVVGRFPQRHRKVAKRYYSGSSILDRRLASTEYKGLDHGCPKCANRTITATSRVCQEVSGVRGAPYSVAGPLRSTYADHVLINTPHNPHNHRTEKTPGRPSTNHPTLRL